MHVDGWLNHARNFAVELAKTRENMAVSVNDLFDGIVNGSIYAPPKIKHSSSGQLMCSVFLGVPYFHNTRTKIAGNNPASKGRKVYVWEYKPEFDDRLVPYSSSKQFYDDVGCW